MFPKHVVRISPTLYATHTVWYGKEKKSNRELASRIMPGIEKIETELHLKGHRFILRALRQKNLNWLTYPGKLVTFIDPRRHSYDEVLYTFLHESIHLKQVQDGDLIWDESQMSLVWKGKSFLDIKAINEITLKKYSQLPWELDVGAQQNMIWSKIFDKDPPWMREKKD